jgi:hypothetical protein
LLLFKKSVYFKGTVQREISSFFLHIWIGLGMNKNSFWYRKFSAFLKNFRTRSSSFSGLGLSIYVKKGIKIPLDCPFKGFSYYYLARHSSVRSCIRFCIRIRIRTEIFTWIRIRFISVRIRTTGKYPPPPHPLLKIYFPPLVYSSFSCFHLLVNFFFSFYLGFSFPIAPFL